MANANRPPTQIVLQNSENHSVLGVHDSILAPVSGRDNSDTQASHLEFIFPERGSQVHGCTQFLYCS